MNIKISEEEYNRILRQIQSDESPVGIDAGKTHVLILYKLMEIDRRLNRIENRLSDSNR